MLDLEHISADIPSAIDEDLDDPTPSPLILVHMDPEELNYLDYFQGGPSFVELVPGDPETKIREYSRISDLMAIPEIKDIWDRIFADMMAQEGAGEHLSDDIAAASHDPDPTHQGETGPMSPFEFSSGDFDPDIVNIEAAGQIKHEDDTEIAYMPLDFANYLDSFRGETDRDPVYKLRQYGKKKGIFGWGPKIVKEVFVRPLHQITGIKMTHINEGIRVGSTIAGALLGGPIGAGIGTAAGNWATGADLETSLMRGAKVGAADYAAGALMGGMGLGSAGASETAGGSLGGLGGETNPATSNPGIMSGLSGNGGGTGGFFGGSNLLPMAAISGLLYKGHQDERNESEALKEQHDRMLAETRAAEGYTIPYRKSKFRPRSLNPQSQSYEDMMAGKQHQYFTADPYGQYAKGGSVEHDPSMQPGEEYVTGFKYLDGDTHGQADKVPINLPPGAWVTDASFTSMLGDGNSKAGAKVVKAISDKYSLKAKNLSYVEIPKGRVPSLLSDGEAVIPPEAVSAIGDGDNKKGSKIMKIVTETVRKDKSRNKGGLPPKLPSIMTYISKAQRKVLNA